MQQKINHRLKTLKAEMEAGQKLLVEYEEKQRNVRETLLRISGAIQVLEEIIAKADSEEKGEVEQPAEKQAEIEPLGLEAE